MPKSLLEYTSIKLGSSAQYDQSLTWTYFRHTHVFFFFLKKVWEVAFLIFLKGKLRPTVSI